MNLDREGVPITAQDALELWDSGQPVPAIRVEAEANTQDAIYELVFEAIRRGFRVEDLAANADALRAGAFIPTSHLTKREIEAVHSVAIVALKKGWQAMLAQHDHPSIAKLTVQKPKVSAA